MNTKKLSETKLYKSNNSVITTIPKTIIELENIDVNTLTTNEITMNWNYEIKDNKIKYTVEFIKK